MNSRIGALALCLSYLLTSAAIAAAPIMQREELVVLRGGDVLRGVVSRRGERYVVADAKGGEIRVPADLVEMHVATLQEAYRRKYAAIDRRSAAQQVVLADWCLRNQLLKEAADRLLAATIIDPNHAGIRRVENRLMLATHAAGVSTPASQTADKIESAPAQQQTITDVPRGAAERFANSVQPLLLSRCAGCHRPNSRLGYQLLRPARGRAVPRGFTDRNLQASLALVNRANPAASPLLVVAQRPHGGAEALIDHPAELPWRQLSDWIESLTLRASLPPTVDPSRVALPRPMPENPPKPPASAKESNVPRPDGRNNVPRKTGTPDGLQPRDPFDPAIFNRRFAKQPPD